MTKGEVLNYEKMVSRSLMQVVKETLDFVSANGLPEGHYFQMTFATTHPNCVLSNKLHTVYPSEMTIILQYEFSNLEVDDEGFSVTLSFSNIPETIYIPFASLRFFVDTPANFGLQFEPELAPGKHKSDTSSSDKAKPAPALTDTSAPTKVAAGDSAEVIDFSAFKR